MDADERVRYLEKRMENMEEAMKRFRFDMDEHQDQVRTKIAEHASLIDQTNERFSISEPKLERQFAQIYKMLEDVQRTVIPTAAPMMAQQHRSATHYDIHTPTDSKFRTALSHALMPTSSNQRGL